MFKVIIVLVRNLFTPQLEASLHDSLYSPFKKWSTSNQNVTVFLCECRRKKKVNENTLGKLKKTDTKALQQRKHKNGYIWPVPAVSDHISRFYFNTIVFQE